jgi:hypothetical protein
VLLFLCKGTTCTSLSLSGKVDVSKDLFIILEMGFATTDLDNFKILEDISSFPVDFFIKTEDNHPSIKAIKENKTETDQFIFNPINEEFVNKEINKVGIKKATGKEGISSKILKLSKSVVAKPISKIINKSFETSTFPA